MPESGAPEPVVFEKPQACSGCGNATSKTGIKFPEHGAIVALCPRCRSWWPLQKLEAKLSKGRTRPVGLGAGGDFHHLARKVA